jgi:hypothetical protein
LFINYDTSGKPSVSESNVSIGESLQEISPTEYLADEGPHNGTKSTDVNSEVNGKLDQDGGMEPSNTQNKIDLNKGEESTGLNNEVTDTPTNITDNETTFTGINNIYCTVCCDYANFFK